MTKKPDDRFCTCCGNGNTFRTGSGNIYFQNRKWEYFQDRKWKYFQKRKWEYFQNRKWEYYNSIPFETRTLWSSKGMYYKVIEWKNTKQMSCKRMNWIDSLSKDPSIVIDQYICIIWIRSNKKIEVYSVNRRGKRKSTYLDSSYTW